MGYTTYDLSESLDRVHLDHAAVESVSAAWGDTNGGGGNWEGGFLLVLRDGRHAYVTGWCDYTGWGCQDGAQVYYLASAPERSSLPGPYEETTISPDVLWDDEPADLNRYVRGEIDKHDGAV